MRGESAGRAVTRGADLLTGRDRVDGDRYQVNTVGGAEEVLQDVGSLRRGFEGTRPLPRGG